MQLHVETATCFTCEAPPRRNPHNHSPNFPPCHESPARCLDFLRKQAISESIPGFQPGRVVLGPRQNTAHSRKDKQCSTAKLDSRAAHSFASVVRELHADIVGPTDGTCGLLRSQTPSPSLSKHVATSGDRKRKHRTTDTESISPALSTLNLLLAAPTSFATRSPEAMLLHGRNRVSKPELDL